MQAVDGVSFALEPGEVLAIVGESGSGKSVTAQTIIGLTRAPNATIDGSVELSGEELTTQSERSCRTSAAADRDDLPGPDDLDEPRLPVGEQIVEAIRAHDTSMSKQDARERKRSSCSTRSASPTPTGASTITRTNSPAGCGSAR